MEEMAAGISNGETLRVELAGTFATVRIFCAAILLSASKMVRPTVRLARGSGLLLTTWMEPVDSLSWTWMGSAAFWTAKREALGSRSWWESCQTKLGCAGWLIQVRTPVVAVNICALRPSYMARKAS